MIIKRLLAFIILISNFLLFSNSQKEVKPEDSTIKVFTSVLAQKYFVEEIGGERVTCKVLVGPGKNPATYQPSPSQIINLSNSDILFTIGVPFENAFLDKIKETLKGLKVVDSSVGINKRIIQEHHHDGENYDDHDDEKKGSLDPHVWLSPVLAKTIANNIYNTLVNEDPLGKEYYSLRLNSLLLKLEAVTVELHKLLKPVEEIFCLFIIPHLGILPMSLI